MTTATRSTPRGEARIARTIAVEIPTALGRRLAARPDAGADLAAVQEACAGLDPDDRGTVTIAVAWSVASRLAGSRCGGWDATGDAADDLALSFACAKAFDPKAFT